jgi:hypothetical protein
LRNWGIVEIRESFKNGEKFEGHFEIWGHFEI